MSTVIRFYLLAFARIYLHFLVVRVRSAQRGKRVKSPRPQALTQAFIYKALKFIEMKLDLTENLFDTTHGA